MPFWRSWTMTWSTSRARSPWRAAIRATTLVNADHAAVLQRQDSRVRLGERDAAGLGAHHHLAEHYRMLSQIDEFDRPQAVLSAPNLGRSCHVLAVPVKTAIAGLDKPHLDRTRRVILKAGVPGDHDRLQIAAVVRLHRELHVPAQARLPEARAGRQLGDETNGGGSQPREAQRKSLIERPARPLTPPRSDWRTISTFS
jgi:hypothetical protein